MKSANQVLQYINTQRFYVSFAYPIRQTIVKNYGHFWHIYALKKTTFYGKFEDQIH